MKPKLFVFILGLIVGLLIALVLPPILGDWLPDGMADEDSNTTGKVVAKRLQADRLLLTIESDDGAVLATFQQKVPEIDLLVESGDQVTLGITRYEPFVTDPEILGVKKGSRPDGAEAAPAAGGEMKPEADGEDEASGDGPEAGEEESPTLPPMGPPLEGEGTEQQPPPTARR